jgi:hypothetical protein
VVVWFLNLPFLVVFNQYFRIFENINRKFILPTIFVCGFIRFPRAVFSFSMHSWALGVKAKLVQISWGCRTTQSLDAASTKVCTFFAIFFAARSFLLSDVIFFAIFFENITTAFTSNTSRINLQETGFWLSIRNSTDRSVFDIALETSDGGTTAASNNDTVPSIDRAWKTTSINLSKS